MNPSQGSPLVLLIFDEYGKNYCLKCINSNVTACDIKETALPDEAIDIVVFSLSLMGRNWRQYIAEAKRCLATNGYLLIAETTKSVKGRLSTIKQVLREQGFELYEEEERGDFTFNRG